MIGRRFGALLVACLSAAAAGCSVPVRLGITINRDGAGMLAVETVLDTDAQTHLGITSSQGGDEIAERLAPWANAGAGWSAPGAQSVASTRESDGTLTLYSSHRFRSAGELRAILSDTRQPTGPLLRGAVPPQGLPAEVPLIATFNASMTPKAAPDLASYNLFGRGGVGELSSVACSGADLARRGNATDKALRLGLRFEYRMVLPETPTRTTGSSAPGDPKSISWKVPYGDCPRISANSTQGSSSTVLNGLILLGAGVFIGFILLFRGFRRRKVAGSLIARG